MLHICCIRAGDHFSPAYVTNLKDMVARNLEAGFPGRFVCFTDRPEDLPDDIETAPLPADLPGWWSKLALFREGLFPTGDRVLFLDLDTLITGAFDRLAAYDGPFAILRDFYRPNGFQSSIMAWQAGEQTEIWNSYERAGCPMDNPGGDQAWIELHACKGRVRLLQTLFPGMYVSYKQSRGIPAEASVVVFHGRPRPHEVTEGWVPRVWCEGGISHAELKAVCNTAQEALLANVKAACARDLRWFEAAEDHDRHIAIIGGGPSVVDMIEEIRWRQSVGQDVWVLNNAHKALDGADIRYDAQVLLDARPDTADFIAHQAGMCFVASQCDPAVFRELRDQRVTLWHVNSPGMPELLVQEKDRLAYLIGGGTTVGMNAIALAFARGYRKIHLYGFDSCYRDGEHHAYPQALNDGERHSEVLYGDKTYICAPWMVGQAQEFAEMAPAYEADGCTITVHGSGLLPDIARDLACVQTPAQQRAAEILSRVGVGARGIEIGVFAGDLSRELLKADPDLNLIMIDSWEGDGQAYLGDSGDWHATLPQCAQDDFLVKTQKRVAFANGRAQIIRKRSTDALADVPDRSCDFVFIDADHSYEGCRADIDGWARKLRPGGWLGGHDYQNTDFEKFGVTRSVDEFVARSALQLETGQNFCWFTQLPMETTR